MAWIYAVAVAAPLGLAAMAWLFLRAPSGYEDDEGFHFGENKFARELERSTRFTEAGLARESLGGREEVAAVPRATSAHVLESSQETSVGAPARSADEDQADGKRPSPPGRTAK